MKARLLKALLAGVTAVFIAGCGGSDGSSQAGGAIKSTSLQADGVPAVSATDQTVSQTSSARLLSSNLKGYVVESSIWPTKTIPVCFAVSDETFQATEWQRQIIRSAVENSWEANSEVQFTGWDICPGPIDQWVRSIRVKFEDGRPRSGVGTGVYPLGMYLNPVYNFYYHEDCGNDIKKCLEFDAIHEFGHALGFSHEQNRPDTPESCTEEKDAHSEGYTPVGGWDLYSIMNYCNPNIHKVGAAVLSQTDIETVQRFYGKPGGTLYVVTKQGGPIQEITAYDTVSKGVSAVIKLPTDTKSLIKDITASPDGKRIYVLSSYGNGGSYLTAINTATNEIAYVKNSYMNGIKQVEVSPDNTTLYALMDGGSVPFELLDAETGRPEEQLLFPQQLAQDLEVRLFLWRSRKAITTRYMC